MGDHRLERTQTIIRGRRRMPQRGDDDRPVVLALPWRTWPIVPCPPKRPHHQSPRSNLALLSLGKKEAAVPRRFLPWHCPASRMTPALTPSPSCCPDFRFSNARMAFPARSSNGRSAATGEQRSGSGLAQAGQTCANACSTPPTFLLLLGASNLSQISRRTVYSSIFHC